MRDVTNKLKESPEYKEWIVADLEYESEGGKKAELVLEHEIDKPLGDFPSTFISIVKRGDTYRIYRTFAFDSTGETAGVSVDHSGLTAEKVFEILLDRYSQKRN